MQVWVRHSDPNNKYGATFTLGQRDTQLPKTAMISVTRGEKFNLIRIIINGVVNEFVKKQLMKNENLIYGGTLWAAPRGNWPNDYCMERWKINA